MNDKAYDKDTGISIRFIRQWDPDKDRWPLTLPTVFELALQLANGDERDIPFAEKMADAAEFIIYKRRQVH